MARQHEGGVCDQGIDMTIQVKTQAELEAALTKNDIIEMSKGNFMVKLKGSQSPQLVVCGKASLVLVARESSQPRVEAWGSSQPRVEAWESSQPRVEARGSSQPRVVAWGSSQPHVVAWGSSQPRVEARGSSQPRVEAWGSSQPRVEARESSQPRVEAWESSQPRVVARGWAQLSIFGQVIVKAVASVAVLIEGIGGKVTGGKQTRRPEIATGKEWCDYYGVPIVRGVAVLYKALDNDFKATHGLSYAPGTMPKAPDWDGGEVECGGGLHFSPHPQMARAFKDEETRVVACPVKVSEIVVHKAAEYLEKVKAPRVCAPCWEVDEDEERVTRTKHPSGKEPA